MAGCIEGVRGEVTPDGRLIVVGGARLIVTVVLIVWVIENLGIRILL